MVVAVVEPRSQLQLFEACSTDEGPTYTMQCVTDSTDGSPLSALPSLTVLLQVENCPPSKNCVSDLGFFFFFAFLHMWIFRPQNVFLVHFATMNEHKHEIMHKWTHAHKIVHNMHPLLCNALDMVCQDGISANLHPHLCRMKSAQQDHRHVLGVEGFLGLSKGEQGSKRAQNGLISLVCALQAVQDHFGTFNNPFAIISLPKH